MYAVFSGPVPRECRHWAAVLRAGPGSVLSHETAAELVGLCAPTPLIHVTVPNQRRIATPHGVALHWCGYLARKTHPNRTPPQTRVEDTAVDLTQTARSVDDALRWLIRACGSRLTTPGRLASTIGARSRIRWRAELVDALADVADGSHSILERRFLHDVERPHALPRAQRQVRRRSAGSTRYHDIRYEQTGVVVELDGRAAHPDAERWRDLRRDNYAVVAGDRVLRYGWRDVATNPCAVAAQVAVVLRAAGWSGRPKPCTRPNCMIR